MNEQEGISLSVQMDPICVSVLTLLMIKITIILHVLVYM